MGNTYSFLLRERNGGAMNLVDIQNLITTLGFPIACTIALGFFVWKIWQQDKADSTTREEKLYMVITESQVQNKQLSETNAEFVTVLSTYKSDLEEIKNDVTDIKTNITTMKG